jgi:hypothetical protein
MVGRTTASVVERRIETDLAPLGRTVGAAVQPLLDLLGLRLPTTVDASSPASPADGGAAAQSEAPHGGALAIAGYDDLPAADIVPRLAALDRGELEAVRAHEAAHRARRTILNRVDQLLARLD